MSTKKRHGWRNDGADLAPINWNVNEGDREQLVDLLNAEERILACQYQAQPRIETPELRLAWQCFLLAMADLFPVTYAKPWRSDQAREAHEDALAWLNSTDTSHIYSFSSLADLFGFDADGLRAKLLARIARGERPKLPRAGESHPVRPKRLKAAA
jgi:hypothetical protein